MKVLYIATSFPEAHRGSTIYTDLAEALHEAGHKITVAVTEETRNKQRTEMKVERGFEVLRIVTGNYYDVGFIEKGITTLKIPVLMKLGIKKFLKNRAFDFILYEAPPISNAGLVAWAKNQFKCSAYLMLKDIFPQNAVDLGIIRKKSLLYRYFAVQEKKLFQVSDYIGCMSFANKQYVLQHNPWLNAEKLELFPNTKRLTDAISQRDFPMRDKYGIPREACVFLFGGNMGRPQYIDLLCKIIEDCKNESSLYFLFVGRGTDRHKLERVKKENNITNASLIENMPRNEYEQMTRECDIGLVVLDPRFTIPNYPSRILSYMEYSKPVLAATDKATDIKELIEEADCGLWIWSGDTQGFILKAKEMAKSKRLSEMGINGRKYAEDNFDVGRSVKILEKHFT